MGCQQTCQSKQLQLERETGQSTDSEVDYTESSIHQNTKGSRKHRTTEKKQRAHNNTNSDLYEYIKQREIQAKGSLIVNFDKKAKAKNGPSVFNLCCNAPQKEPSEAASQEQNSQVMAQGSQRFHQHLKNEHIFTKLRKKSQSSHAVMVNQHKNLISNKDILADKSYEKLFRTPAERGVGGDASNNNKSSDRSQLMPNKSQNQDLLCKTPQQQAIRKNYRKSTNPVFFQHYQQFNVLQNKLQEDEVIREYKPKRFTLESNIVEKGNFQQKVNNSSQSSSQSGHSINGSKGSSEERKRSLKRSNEKTRFHNQGPITIENLKNKEVADDSKKSHVKEFEEVKRQSFLIDPSNFTNILTQIKDNVGNQGIRINQSGQDERSQEKRENISISYAQPPNSGSQNANGPAPTVEIRQQEVTKIKEYYYQNTQKSGDSPKNQTSNIVSQNPTDNENLSPGKLNALKLTKQFKTAHDHGDKGERKHSRKKKHRGKKKVIETTKTTSVLFHGGVMGLTQPIRQQHQSNISPHETGLLNSNAKSGEELKIDQDASNSPDNGKRQRKSPRKEKKGRDKKKSKSNNLKDGLKQMKSQKIEVQEAGDQDDPQYTEFQNKWKQRQKDTVHHNRRDYHSVLTFKKQLSQSSVSQDPMPSRRNRIVNMNQTVMNLPVLKKENSFSKPHQRRASINSGRRMTLSKQLFIGEGKGKIEQKYEFLEVLGQGGFGLVRKVKHKISGELRAMKVIQIDQYDSTTLNCIQNEIEILKQLDHPNIVKIFEFYQDKKAWYIIQEYIGGGDLFEKIKVAKCGFDENIAALIMKQVLSAVFYCHKNGIVHRDLKPENILLEDSKSFNNIKIIDFGTSRNFQNQKKMNQKYGTSYYIAPEVLKKNYDEKCDIWSCGVILHILLSGYPPFRGKNEKEILEKVETGYFSLSGPEWKSVSREAKILLKQLLTYESKERITAEQALNHTWIQIQTKTEVVTHQDAQNALHALRNFHVCKGFQWLQIDLKIQQAACLYIASQLLTRQEILKFKDVFNCFDLNGDGCITSEELKELLVQHLYLSKDKAGKESLRILQNIDINQNGAVDFTEFVIAIVSTKDILTDDKLLNAFNMLDMDGNGRITKEDLKQVFKNSPDINQDEMLNEMIEEADERGQGEIAFQEFKNLMLSMQKQPPAIETILINFQNESISQGNLLVMK